MRKMKYSEYLNKKSLYIRERARSGGKRTASSRIRDEKERDLLVSLDKARLRKWAKSGKLVYLGPRKYRFSP